MNERVRATFHPAAAEWRGHFAAAAQGAAAWAERGRLANRGLHVLRELLLLLPDWDGLLPEVGQFLEAVHQASAATVTMLVPGARSHHSLTFTSFLTFMIVILLYTA